MDKKTIIELKRDQSMIFIVDMQDRLMNAMCDENEVLIKNQQALLEAAKVYNFPVFFSEQYPKGLGKTNCDIARYLDELNAFGYEKTAYNAISEEILQKLKATRRKQIIVVGIESHICVFQTCRTLLENGFDVFVPHDGVSSRNIKNKQNGLQLLEKMGVVVASTELILFDWIKDAKDPNFKLLQSMIK